MDASAELRSVEALQTLPHSAVHRLVLADGRQLILKHAGAPEFAAGMRKESTRFLRAFVQSEETPKAYRSFR